MCQIINITKREYFTAIQIVQAKQRAKNKLFLFQAINGEATNLYLVDAHHVIAARHRVLGHISQRYGGDWSHRIKFQRRL